MYTSQKFKDCSTHEIITLLYSFYTVHAGGVHFLRLLYDDLLLRLDEKTTTYDLLRVLQSYSEISKDYPKLFLLLENLFIQRFEQMTTDELTTCASGFSISGFGSPYFSGVLERGILSNIGHLSTQSLKEVARGFVFSMRGSKQLHQVILPRIRPILNEFTLSEVCYMLYSYH